MIAKTKKRDVPKPKTAAKLAINLYSNNLSLIVEKMMRPNPRTIKLLMNVKEFLKLLSLSYVIKCYYSFPSGTS